MDVLSSGALVLATAGWRKPCHVASLIPSWCSYLLPGCLPKASACFIWPGSTGQLLASSKTTRSINAANINILFGYFWDRIQAYSHTEFGSCIWTLFETGAYKAAKNHKMDGFLSEKRNPGWGMSFPEDTLTGGFGSMNCSLAPPRGSGLSPLLYSLHQRPGTPGKGVRWNPSESSYCLGRVKILF